jgi:hypothetical protein
MGFTKGDAQEKPRSANLGRVAEIGEAKVSRSQKYCLVKWQIEGYGASENIRGIFLWRPEWIVEGFKPSTLGALDEGDTFEMLYRNNVASREGMSVLQGLCGGDEEKFDELASRIFALNIDPKGEVEPILDGVQGVLQKFLIDEKNGDNVGYVCGHQMTKTDEVDPDTGKNIYVREKYREVKSWFDPTNKKTNKGPIKRADKSEGKFVVSFTENEVPF